MRLLATIKQQESVGTAVMVFITVEFFTDFFCRLFHVILTVVFQALIMRDMEKLAGAIRITIIYFGSGIGGNLASAIFLPYHVEVNYLSCEFNISCQRIYDDI